ncbi:MAG: YezD family protein [Oscillospiraceae bacterium]|jgi:hypothetical protein|nr:YezD family protein [Oscillospiraceae bacterium]
MREITFSVPNSVSEEKLKQIIHYLEEIKFGSITLVIHDGKVVMVEKLEKTKI